MHLKTSVSKILARASMVLQNYQKLIEITSNMIYIVALGGGFKCPCNIHLNTQWRGGGGNHHILIDHLTLSYPGKGRQIVPTKLLFTPFLRPCTGVGAERGILKPETCLACRIPILRRERK